MVRSTVTENTVQIKATVADELHPEDKVLRWRGATRFLARSYQQTACSSQQLESFSQLQRASLQRDSGVMLGSFLYVTPHIQLRDICSHSTCKIYPDSSLSHPLQHYHLSLSPRFLNWSDFFASKGYLTMSAFTIVEVNRGQRCC